MRAERHQKKNMQKIFESIAIFASNLYGINI